MKLKTTVIALSVCILLVGGCVSTADNTTLTNIDQTATINEINFNFSSSHNPKTTDNIQELTDYGNMIHVDEMTFDFIKQQYDQIDFYGNFKEGKPSDSDFYKMKYKQLLDNKIKFRVNNQEEYYLADYMVKTSYLSNDNDYNPMDYIYYFYDIDEDNNYELCVSDDSRFIYILKYNLDSDSFVLWHEMLVNGYELLGSRKYSWNRFDENLAFYVLDVNANFK